MIKNRKVTIRFSEEEEQIIEERARMVNMSKSEFIREKTLEREICGSMAKTDIAVHLIHVQNLLSSIGSEREKNKEIYVDMRKEVDKAWQSLK